eukprot:CAMPEP_0197541876 /NCGR_PEP_ID=MMETSP1318-20131121/67400_1 /TAXON_ID=552666 /ORGANISM="Partenskyella glossopodia, Strain RCC365" /LENGTH=359 /DNA_ID=CAMNT_0043101093 /DNA_START=1279 /DNA_END=2355 /DNA_ORIENTATION=-
MSAATVAVVVSRNQHVLRHNPLFITYVPDSSPLVSDFAGKSSVGTMCQDCQVITDNATCYRDCAGEWIGSAALDACGVCSGGTTGIAPNADADCQGVCFGPFKLLSNGWCACVHNETFSHQKCVEAGFNSLFKAQSEETLCCNPSDLQIGANHRGFKIVGSDLKTPPKASTIFLNIARTGPKITATYDADSRALVAPLPAPLEDLREPATVSLRLNADAVEIGNWMFLKFQKEAVEVGSEEGPCGACAQSVPREVCKLDCAGVEGGEAWMDECGVCSEGTTGHAAGSDKDCLGICFGPYRVTDAGCICPPNSPDFCKYYLRETGDTSFASTFKELEFYYILLVTLSSILLGGMIASVMW